MALPEHTVITLGSDITGAGLMVNVNVLSSPVQPACVGVILKTMSRCEAPFISGVNALKSENDGEPLVWVLLFGVEPNGPVIVLGTSITELLPNQPPSSHFHSILVDSGLVVSGYIWDDKPNVGEVNGVPLHCASVAGKVEGLIFA